MRKINTAKKVYNQRGLTGLLKQCWLTAIQRSPAAHAIESILGKSLHEKLIAAPLLGYWPKIEKPRSLNEKILYRKIYTNESLYTKVSDKWRAREYVKNKVGQHVLNDVYYIGQNPLAIPFEDLPEKFVIKATHGSGWNTIIKNKNNVDVNAIESKCNKWLNQTYGERFREYWYQNITPRILVESFLDSEDYEIPLDYKFFVFEGEVKCVQVDFNRFEKHRQRFYDPNWNTLEFKREFELGHDIKRPKNLDDMIDMAEKIGEELGFARVDLYNPTDDKIVFGEITLAPQGGTGRFYPIDYDFKLGSYWDL